MNYNEFIKAVDEKLNTMSDNEKEKWIHNLARTIKEHYKKIHSRKRAFKAEFEL